MKYWKLFFMQMLLLLLFLSCTKQELRLLRVEEYRSWQTTTSEILTYPIPGHEDKHRRIFISPEGLGLTRENKGGRTYHSYPPGTQIIKEILDPNGKETDLPLMLTAMIKQPQDPRARGGWIWVVYTPASKKETVVTEEFCISCHGNANEPHPYGDRNPDNEFRDYVFFPYKPVSYKPIP